MCNADAAAAATRDGFDTNRVSDFFCELHGIFSGIDCAFFAIFPFAAPATGDEFQPCLRGFLPRLDFVAQRLQVGDSGADEVNLMRLTHLGELRIFREKPGTGMDSINVSNIGDRDDIGIFQVAIRGRGRPDAVSLIGVLDMQRIGIRRGEDSHGFNAHIFARADNADGYLTPIGDKDFFEHFCCSQCVRLAVLARECLSA